MEYEMKYMMSMMMTKCNDDIIPYLETQFPTELSDYVDNSNTC